MRTLQSSGEHGTHAGMSDAKQCRRMSHSTRGRSLEAQQGPSAHTPKEENTENDHKDCWSELEYQNKQSLLVSRTIALAFAVGCC